MFLLMFFIGNLWGHVLLFWFILLVTKSLKKRSLILLTSINRISRINLA